VTRALSESDDSLLKEWLARTVAAGREITQLRRRPFAYATSAAIEELTLTFADGSRVELLAKDVGPAGLSAHAAAIKPAFVADPLREPAVYRSILEPANVGAPRFLGAALDPPGGVHWVFLERVDGEMLADVGELERWEAAAGWLARLQATVTTEAATRAAGRALLVRDERLLRRWIERSLKFTAPARAGGRPEAGRYRDLIQRVGDRLVDGLDSLPRAFVHGELYPSNVLVARADQAPRVAAIDWELAGIGPFALDLAALTSGWPRPARESMCRAYLREREARGAPVDGGLHELLHAVALCRLSLAVQWLGWAEDWTPPAEHGHDWLAEAIALMEEAELV
jgi:Ser/Thr protein kinase RdoA (MazF antagonist)